MLNIYDKNFEIWESELADFTLQKIGHKYFVFGTKFPEDIIKLKNIGYNCFDNQFAFGAAGNDNAIITKNRLF